MTAPVTGPYAEIDEVTISRNVLEEVYERLAEAIGAVERGNNRTVGNNRLWTCLDAIWRNGKAPSGCQQSTNR